MSEIVLGPTTPLRFASHGEKTKAICAAYLDALLDAMRADPKAALDWLTDAGVAVRRGARSYEPATPRGHLKESL